MTWTVRTAALADAEGIATVHVATWRAAYAGILPDAYLASLDAAQRRARWAELLTAPPARGQTILVAEDAGEVVGFVNGGPDRGDAGPDAGEIRALYVRTTHWDRGVGRALHDAALSGLRAADFATAVLWVLEGNARARRFYERQGWAPDGASKTETRFGGAPLVELRYAVGLRAPAETGARGAGS